MYLFLSEYVVCMVGLWSRFMQCN